MVKQVFPSIRTKQAKSKKSKKLKVNLQPSITA